MKQPNWKTPLILSLTLFILGGFAYWLEYSHRPKKEKSDSAQKKPLNFNADEAQIASFKIRGTKITLDGKCDELAQKKCKLGDSPAFSITEPRALKGDTENIKSALNTIGNSIAPETLDLTEDAPEKRVKLMQEFGLSEDSRNNPTTPMVEFTLDNGKKYTAWFGIEHPIGDKYYVAAAEDGKLNDKTVFLVSSFAKGVVDHDLTYFRDKTIFNFNREDITQLTGKNSSGAISAKRNEKEWTINGHAGDYDKIEVLLSSIAQIKAKEFPEAKDALSGAQVVVDYKLESPKSKITVQVLEKTIAKTKEKHFYLKTSERPDAVEIEAAIRNQLDKKVNELRSTVVLAASEQGAIQRIKLEGAKYKTPVELKMEGGKWIATNPKENVDTAKAGALLSAFVKTKIKDFVSPAPKGADEVRVTMGDEKSPARYKWAVFHVKEKIFYKDLNKNSNEAYEIDFEVKNALPVDSESWMIKK